MPNIPRPEWHLHRDLGATILRKYADSVIKAYKLATLLRPAPTDEEPAIGGSGSVRAMPADGRAILASGWGLRHQ